ncbi:hypothetical protein WG68_07600 [Arsukibacterium ikkense]|uniref:Uncharacterized protein n=1 Tax=Arsukibacterium ikkense TaxID=336831 RepID=A0A0M2V6F4_9GAMM|nr:hypothetical protein [Arsukibacterium ikkense]KKO45994.1 hypothetical protein WG68_07600 [Arsukibacterium ikkense]
MKKFFWLAVIVLLILTFSDHELIRPYRDQVYGLILDRAPSSGKMSDQQALRQVQKQLNALTAKLGESQQQQLSRAAESKESLLVFYQRYCVNRDFNPILFGEPLRESCSIISSHMEALTGP